LASCASETALDPEADTLLITEDTVPSHAVTPAMPRELTPQTYEEALSLYDCGRYAETIEKLSALCWDGPADTFPAKRAQGLTLLTRAYANRGQLAEAQVWCERALALNTLDPVLHYLRATIALEYGQEAEARSSLTRAVSLDQRFVLAHFILGVIARQRHDRQEAREHFSEALRLLRQYHPDDILPDSEGMSAGRLAHMLVEMNEEL
jgi:chemotaxis protein methyltransferase CheR